MTEDQAKMIVELFGSGAGVRPRRCGGAGGLTGLLGRLGRVNFLMGSENLLLWNVRGQSPRELVANLFAETKKTVLTDFDISQLFGAGFDYMYLPVIRTRGNSGCMARRELVGYQHFDAPVLLLRPCSSQLLVALNGGYCRFMTLHNSLQSCTS
jgi:hypothetical protein